MTLAQVRNELRRGKRPENLAAKSALARRAMEAYRAGKI